MRIYTNFLKNSVGGKKNFESNSRKVGFFLSSALQNFFTGNLHILKIIPDNM